MADKSGFITAMRLVGKVLPGNRLKTLFFLYGIQKPRRFIRNCLNSFYRMEIIYDALGEFGRTYKGKFSILEFGVADGYTFTKMLYATQFMKLSDRVTVHGFDSFEGMPEAIDKADRDLVANDGWVKGQFRSSYEELDEYCRGKYPNYRLHKGYFEETLSTDVLAEFDQARPILIWIDCDYYSSAKVVFERLIPHIPTGCVIYFDEYEFNFGSRFTGEARIVHEVNQGMFGEGLELVRDHALSLNSNRVYRFINANNTEPFERVEPLNLASELRRRTNDSPMP